MISKYVFSILLIGFASWSSAQMNPKYIATVGGEYSGEVRKGMFLAQQGVAGKVKINAQHWESITVKSFQLIAFRDSTALFQYRNVGNKFEDSLKTKLESLLVGDRVLIFDIWAFIDESNTVLLQPLEYHLK